MLLLRLVKCYATWLCISLAVCFLGVLSGLLSSRDVAVQFAISYIRDWNGLLVPALGCGTLHFALSTQRHHFHRLVNGILSPPEHLQPVLYQKLESLFSVRNKQPVALAVFVVGSFILYSCGYPLHGIPKHVLWLSSSAMFYVGGLMLAYSLSAISLFSVIESNCNEIGLQEHDQLFELEEFSTYLSVLFLSGAISLYVAFRGTLTANLTFAPPFEWFRTAFGVMAPGMTDYKGVRMLLVYPLVVFMPLGAFAGLYMRSVLIKIHKASLQRKIRAVDDMAGPVISGVMENKDYEQIIKLQKLALDLKEGIKNAKTLALVGVKDAPSLVVLAAGVAQFIYRNDGALKDFLNQLK